MPATASSSASARARRNPVARAGLGACHLRRRRWAALRGVNCTLGAALLGAGAKSPGQGQPQVSAGARVAAASSPAQRSARGQCTARSAFVGRALSRRSSGGLVRSRCHCNRRWCWRCSRWAPAGRQCRSWRDRARASCCRGFDGIDDFWADQVPGLAEAERSNGCVSRGTRVLVLIPSAGRTRCQIAWARPTRSSRW